MKFDMVAKIRAQGIREAMRLDGLGKREMDLELRENISLKVWVCVRRREASVLQAMLESTSKPYAKISLRNNMNNHLEKTLREKALASRMETLYGRQYKQKLRVSITQKD